MKGSNTPAAAATFIQAMHKITHVGVASMYCLDAMQVGQSHACWKVSECSGGLEVPVIKGGRLIICQAGSANMEVLFHKVKQVFSQNYKVLLTTTGR
jgi:hypothetical protein